MIRDLIHAVRRLDLWLQSRLGRPYNALLGVGLVIEMAHKLSEMPQKIASMPHLVGGVLVLLMELALLIHQVGELSRHVRAHEPRPPHDRRGRRGESPGEAS